MINNQKIMKGDIYFATLDPIIGSEQGGTRPVLIVQNDIGNKHSPTVLIAPLTSNAKKKTYLPTHVLIKSLKGMKCDSIILIEQIRVADKIRLGQFVDRISKLELIEVDKAIICAFGIKEELQ